MRIDSNGNFETVDLTVYCRKLVCNPLKLHGKISLLFITQNDII